MILSPEPCACPLPDGVGVSIASSGVCSGVALFMLLIEGFLRGRCDIAAPCERVQPVDEVQPEYDFIVVGAGPAGSIVASRLSEIDRDNVLLLEAGPEEDISNRIPGWYRAHWNDKAISWGYRTVPEDYCLDQGGKGCDWPRGKVVGGSNVLNGLMYHRGHKADYEDWVKAGATGWSWDENKKFFDLTEGNKQIGSLVKEEHHSSKGPLPIQQFNDQPPFLYELLNAINASDIPVVADMNDPNTPEGFMIAQVMTDHGQRFTTARAFLKPRSERPNLHLRTLAHVTRVLIDDKRRATGVEYIDQNGTKKTVKAKKEVILSAGALNSPHILMLSGIGPAETLKKFNIPVVADLPVGQNLRNHLGMTLYFILEKMENLQILDWAAFTHYILERKGPMSSTGITQLTGILSSSLADKARSQPDLQFFFNGFYAECSKTGAIGEKVGDGDCYLRGRNISANAVALLPRSVGYLTLNSSDPLDPPLFYPGYFSHKDDMVMVSDAARYLKKIFDSDVMKNTYGAKLDPVYADACNKSAEWSDEWIECMARTYTDPQNHQLGTAAMGRVIDPQLRVYNVTGLRVADASSMPTQPTGNPQAAIMLVGERAAAFIKDEYA